LKTWKLEPCPAQQLPAPIQTAKAATKTPLSSKILAAVHNPFVRFKNRSLENNPA
jgi:hypothetical protein